MQQCRTVSLLLLVVVLVCSTLRAQSPTLVQPGHVESIENSSEPAPAPEEKGGATVELDLRPLITIDVSLAGFSAQERAKGIQERLYAFARNRDIPVEKLTVENHHYWSLIKAGQETIMYVSEEDAKHRGLTRRLLAAQDAEIFRQAVTKYRAEHTWPNRLRGILYSVLTTAVLFVGVLVVARVFRWIRNRAEKWIAVAQARLSAESKWRLLTAYVGPPLLVIVGLLRWAIILLLINLYLTLILGFFPATRILSQRLSGWFLARLSAMTQQFVNYLPDLLIVITIVIATYYLTKLTSLFFRELGTGRLTFRGFYPDWADPTAKLIRVLIMVLAAVIVFPYLPGSTSPAFQGISIFIGVLLSLGSSSAVANAVAGTILTYMRSFQIGDYVKVGDIRGEVVEKNLLVTRICTPKQEIVTIPNGTVMSDSVTNYSAQALKHGVVLYTTVTIGYDAPWRQIHQLLIDAALLTKDVLQDPKPFVLQTSLDDFYVSYQLNAYTDEPGRMLSIYSELHQNIQDKFNDAGVEIMSPHYSQLRDGNQTTIPADFLPANYEPPAFRIRNENSLKATGKGRVA